LCYSKHMLMMDQLGFINSSRGFQASYIISFFISIRIPLSTSHKTSDVTPNPGTKHQGPGMQKRSRGLPGTSHVH
jgi:hypothetical protein